MDRQHILQIAENSLGHIVTVSDGLYKGQINIIDKPAGTFFIDFNENINLETFSSYQENLLSDEYYSLAKEQQWSLYLFMLRDHIDNHFKSEVEKNDRYARKYVFRENEFVDFFTVVRHQDGVRTTIIESWKHSLEEAGLSGVYGDGAIKGILGSLDAGSETPGSIRRIKAASPVEKINYIRRIKLNDNFRTYPVSPRIFDFKKVNLVKGINGAGKTSLFEAIEITLCGATFRNNTFPEKDGCVEAMYNYSTQLELCKPSNLELYRSRDLNWYNVPPGYSNQLHYSFNRFNFFNADAAHRFSSGSADEEIRKALVNIILGPEYEHILNRTEKLIKDVRPTFNKLEVERNTWKAKQMEAENYIKDYKEDRSLMALGKQIDDAVKGLRPVQKIVSITADAVVVEQFVKVIRLLVEGLIKEGLTSSESVAERIKAQAALDKKMVDFRLAMDGFQLEIKGIQDNVKQLQQNKHLLEQAQVYFSNSILFGLEGLQQRTRVTEASVNRLVQLQSNLSDILLDNLKLEGFVGEAIEERASNIATLKKGQQILEDKVRIEMERLGKIQGILQQIKLLSKVYLDSDAAFHKCPLCETEFVREELLFIVQRSQDLNADGDENLKEMNEQIRQMTTTIQISEHELDELRRVRAAFALAFPDKDIKTLKLRDLIDYIEQQLGSLPDLQQTLNDENSLQRAARDAGITDEGFLDLKRKLLQLFPTISFSEASQSFYTEKESEFAAEILKVNEALNAIMEKRALAGVSIKAEFDLLPGEPMTIAQLNQLLSSRKDKVGALAGFMDKLKEAIMTDKVVFDTLHHGLNAIISDIETYKGGLSMQIEWQRMTQQLKIASEELKKGKAKYDRYKLAYQTLTDIREEAGEGQANAFLGQHLTEIADVFKSIHTPREFSDIEIDGRGSIVLKTTGGESRTITQISTGQRSALALSIFLTMNRSLKNGPNIILFDDPISFVDDFNCLSFLDYLRFFIIKERQVFFATANAKLASLFEKKFSFLDNDFQKWELSRES